MVKLDSFSSFFIANWKLNGNFKFIDQFISNLTLPSDRSKCIVICPTSIHLDYMSKHKRGFYVGAQNVSQHKDGAFTGEISAESLSDLNVDFCIVGHSERRQIFNEKNDTIYFKSENLINKNFIPIICIGETLEEKENGKTNDILEEQLKKCIPSSSNFQNTIIAYEPVWAIGTGLTPSIEEIDKTHQFIRGHNSKFNKFNILYGGSVKANNVKEITSLLNVNGALIGGASLKSEEFTKIIQD
ncbi:MAG: triose-phosphate isomerase [Alphaproteobacteria bacterium]